MTKTSEKWYYWKNSQSNTNVYSMHCNIKSYVKSKNETSVFFSCNIGVRQGDSLSPFPFAVFLSNFEDDLWNKNVTGLQAVSQKCCENLRIRKWLFTLLYADDTILLAESASDLQNPLLVFDNYCSIWKLQVNFDFLETMVMDLRCMVQRLKC